MEIRLTCVYIKRAQTQVHSNYVTISVPLSAYAALSLVIYVHLNFWSSQMHTSIFIYRLNHHHTNRFHLFSSSHFSSIMLLLIVVRFCCYFLSLLAVPIHFIGCLLFDMSSKRDDEQKNKLHSKKTEKSINKK